MNGITVPYDAKIRRLTISNNYVKVNLASGIFVGISNDDARVIGNRSHNNGDSYPPTDSGITLQAARGLVSGNEVFGNVNGILASYRQGATDHVTIIGNTVRDNARIGISGGSDVLITNNTVFNNTAGIYLHNET